MLKKILLGVVALIVLAAIALAVVVARFDPNQYKDTIANLVKEKKQRTLKIDGDLKLALWPKLGIEIGKTSLSEHGSEHIFASIGTARLYVATLPLLRGAVVIDRVVVDGLSATLVRDRNGDTNIDDLLADASAPDAAKEKEKAREEKAGGKPIDFEVAGIAIDNASLRYRDEAANRAIALDKLALKTGRVAPGQPVDLELSADVQSNAPQAAINVAMKGTVQSDPAAQRHGVSKLDLRINGAALGIQGLKFTAKGTALADLKAQRIESQDFEIAASGSQGGAPFELNLAAPRLAIGPKEAGGSPVTGSVKLAGGNDLELKFNASAPSGNARALQIGKLALDFKMKQGARETAGTLATPLAENLEQKTVNLAALAGEIKLNDPALPKKALAIPLSGKVEADLGKERVHAELQARIEDSALRTRLDINGFSPLAIGFDLNADQLNVDQFLPPASPAAAPAQAAAAGPEKPIDLSFLQGLNLNGNVRIGKLQAKNIKLSDVALAAKAAGGRLDVSSLTANLYQGSLTGSASVSAANQFVLRQNLTNVAIGPLLKDAINLDMVEGRGNIALDVTTNGKTVSALKSALGGNAKVQLRDGAVKGINLAQTLRDFKSAIGGAKNQTQAADKNAKTDFSELSASFTINNGVASNRDLQAKSPFLRMTGAGDIDIGRDSMDYVARAMLVNTSTGQDGKNLAQLKDVTVPVRITGPFTALRYEIQWAAITSDVLKSSLKDKLTERLGGKAPAPANTAPANNAQQPAPARPEDRLKQQLKDLLR